MAIYQRHLYHECTTNFQSPNFASLQFDWYGNSYILRLAAVLLRSPDSPVVHGLDMGVNVAGLIRSDFWFLDGNIVIIAGQAAFKVHRGQLERHSDVFNDMLSIPQPQDQELVDGCFWFELYDCPSDVFYFLRALYDGLYVPCSFEILTAADTPCVIIVTSPILAQKTFQLSLVFSAFQQNTSSNISESSVFGASSSNGHLPLLAGTTVSKLLYTPMVTTYPANSVLTQSWSSNSPSI